LGKGVPPLWLRKGGGKDKTEKQAKASQREHFGVAATMIGNFGLWQRAGEAIWRLLRTG
jgi:hypothetical protein